MLKQLFSHNSYGLLFILTMRFSVTIISLPSLLFHCICDKSAMLYSIFTQVSVLYGSNWATF